METLAGRPDDDLDRLNRIKFNPGDRDDRVHFEAIIWKRSQTTETIETIESYPRNHHFYSGNRVRKCDVIKMKFLKLWDLSGYSERTMSKRPTCQK